MYFAFNVQLQKRYIKQDYLACYRFYEQLQVGPDLNLEQNRLSNPLFYYSRRKSGINRKWNSDVLYKESF